MSEKHSSSNFVDAVMEQHRGLVFVIAILFTAVVCLQINEFVLGGDSNFWFRMSMDLAINFFVFCILLKEWRMRDTFLWAFITLAFACDTIIESTLVIARIFGADV